MDAVISRLTQQGESRLSEPAKKKNFFVSRTGADAAWAKWIAAELEAAGYSTILQDWDFRPGHSFPGKMQDAITGSERTIAVLSPRYMKAEFTQPEWEAVFVQDGRGVNALLVPVRIAACKPEGLLARIVYIDLVGLDEAKARAALLEGVKLQVERKSGGFPGSASRAPQTAQRFPGVFPESNLPHLRNPNFTGRDDLLRQLREALKGGPAALTQAIHGLGGVGKTQLAVEYVYRFASDYSLVGWVHSETVESRNADYETLAKRLKLFSREERAEQSEVVEAVRRALEQRDGWLLVFDNAPDPKSIVGYRPRGGGGHVIVTSRHAAWGGVARSLRVKVWEPEESVRFLLHRTGLNDKKAAGELAAELGYLPLALEQAAAYVEHAAISLAEYVNLFRKRRLELFQGDWTAEEGPTVTTTWEISFQRVREIFPPAANLLNLCAFFAPDDIPLDVIAEGAGDLPEPLAAVVRDPLELNRAVGLLRDHSLVGVEAEEGGRRNLSIHRLVQAVMQHRLAREEREAWLGASAKVINRAFPFDSDEPQHWPQCERLSPHAAQVAAHSEEAQLSLERASLLLNQLGQYAQGRAELQRARSYYERALAISEKVYGPDHPNVAIRANNIGQILKDQGDLAGALEWTRRALAIDEKVYGPDHPKVAIFANNIGQILKDQGDLAGAQEWAQRALAIDEKAYGPDHPTVAIRANNIGQILQDQGDLAGALEWTQRALAINEKVYGPEHPTVAIFANNIGQILQDQGDLAGALEWTRRALAIGEKVYGPEHPTVAVLANSIGRILNDQGDLAGALEWTKRALAIDEKLYGPDHPTVAIRANNIGTILQAQGDLAGALGFAQRALRICEEFLGRDHPHTRGAAHNLRVIQEAMK